MSVRALLRSHNREHCESIFKSKAFGCYLGQNTALTRILGEYKFFVDTSDIGFTPHIIMDGFWEFWLTQFMAKNIEPGDVVVDVGANHGYYTALMAGLVGDEGRVYAFEPNPRMFGLLKRTIDVNGFASRTNCIDAAIADVPEPSERPFFIPHGEPKNGRFLREEESEAKASLEGQIIRVDVRNPLDFLGNSRIDFLKIDVEGAETEVLRCFDDVIRTHRPKIVVEVNFSRGYDYAEVCDILKVHELRHLEHDGSVAPLTIGMTQTQRVGDDWLVCAGFDKV